MAGMFGDEINGRADFFSELDRAERLLADVRKRPGMAADDTLRSVGEQLAFVREATKDGRTPTAEERKRPDMGLRMSREFEVPETDELAALKDAIQGLNNYFEHWPDDELAADPDNLDVIYGLAD